MGRAMLIETDAGLYCAEGDFHVDPWVPVPRAVLTHAHGDHALAGSAHYLCTPETATLLRRRLGGAPVETLAYGDRRELNGVRVSFHPAGHIRGSAQLRLERGGEVWVVSGDYKRQADPTCIPFEPVRCHTFVTEATFGLPIFRWEPATQVAKDVLAWWDGCRALGRTALLFCYVIGKAQRLLAELAALTERPAHVHGMVDSFTRLYREAGVRMLPTVPVAESGRQDFSGELVLAPLSARGTKWTRRFGDFSGAFASGWMRIRGTRRRQGYDRGFVLSDHADWAELLETAGETGAQRVLVTHGYSQVLARYLCEQGHQAEALATRWTGEVEE